MKDSSKFAPLVSSIALLVVCGGVGAQTAMKATNNESGCRIGYCPSNDPCALEKNSQEISPEPPARIISRSSWSIAAPGVINYCVRIGVEASSTRWTTPLKLKLRDTRTGSQHKNESPTNFSYPNSPPSTPYKPFADRFASISSPIPAGTSKFSKLICEPNFKWYKRPILAVENPLKPGEFCPVEFGPPLKPLKAKKTSQK
jgi:hypothetical protein